MGSYSIVYVGIYALIYQHIIHGEVIVSRDGLPIGVLPPGMFKIEKYCPRLKFRSSYSKFMISESIGRFFPDSIIMSCDSKTRKRKK